MLPRVTFIVRATELRRQSRDSTIMNRSFSISPATLLLLLLFQIDPCSSFLPSRQLQSRQEQTGDGYCFGTEGICKYSNDLSEDCNSLSSEEDLNPWYDCICGNGAVSANQALVVDLLQTARVSADY